MNVLNIAGGNDLYNAEPKKKNEVRKTTPLSKQKQKNIRDHTIIQHTMQSKQQLKTE